MADELKGDALDKALRDAGLSTSGTAEEKRARLAEQGGGGERQAVPAGTGGGEQEDQSNENPEAFAADPHVATSQRDVKYPSQDDLNPGYAPPPSPDAPADEKEAEANKKAGEQKKDGDKE